MLGDIWWIYRRKAVPTYQTTRGWPDVPAPLLSLLCESPHDEYLLHGVIAPQGEGKTTFTALKPSLKNQRQRMLLATLLSSDATSSPEIFKSSKTRTGWEIWNSAEKKSRCNRYLNKNTTFLFAHKWVQRGSLRCRRQKSFGTMKTSIDALRSQAPHKSKTTWETYLIQLGKELAEGE